MNDFMMKIMAALDTSGLKGDLDKFKKAILNDPVITKITLDTTMSKQAIKELAQVIHSAFNDAGITDFKMSVKEIESILNGSIKKAEQEQLKLKKQQNEEAKKRIEIAKAEVLAYEENNRRNIKIAKEKQALIDKEIAKDRELYLAREQADIENESRNRKLAKEKQDVINKEIAKEKELYIAREQAYKIDKQMSDSMSLVSTRADASNSSFNAYLQKLQPKALKEYASSINEISNAFNKAKQTGDKMDYSKASASMSQFKSQMKEAGLETSSLTQKLKENLGAFTNWYLIGGAVSSLIGNFKRAIGTLKEVDTQLTEISKTSDLTGESLKRLGISAFDSASKYGTTVQAYLSGYLEMSRGTDEETARRLAELSILAQSAGDMTAELANEYIVATNAAYGYQNNVDKLNAVLDSQNQISNRNQVSMTELANATKVAGSQAAQSSVEINEMTSAVGTMIASTKQGGEVAGRAFKALLMNLQQVSGEIDGEVFDTESFAKVEKALHNVGVANEEIVNGVAKLRDPMKVLKELAEVYNSLPSDSIDKANIISDIGGKFYGNQLSALLSNWSTYEKMLSDYQNASGSAAAEAQKTADSLEGRLNKLSNTWNRTVANIVDTDLLKFFVSTGEGAIDLVDKTNLLQTALLGLVAFGGYKALSGLTSAFKTAAIEATMLGDSLKQVTSSDFIANTQTMTSVLAGLSQKQMVSVLSTEAMQTAFKNLNREEQIKILTDAGLSSSTADVTAATITSTIAQKAATGSTITLSSALKGLWATMAANPIGALLTVATTVFSILSFTINKAKSESDEYIQTVKQNAESASSLTKEISDLTTKYMDLSDAVKTDNSAKETLISTQNELLSKLGLEGQSIDDLIDKYGSLTEAIQNYSLEQLTNAQNPLINAYSDAKNELNKNVKQSFLIDKATDENKKALDILTHSGYLRLTKTQSNVGAASVENSFYGLNKAFTGDDSLVKYYEYLQEMQNKLKASNPYSSLEELSNDSIWKMLSKEIQKAETYVDNYTSASNELNNNLIAQHELLTKINNDLPTSQKEFDSFKQNIIDSVNASNQFVGANTNIEGMVESYLRTIPTYNQFFDVIVDGSENASNSIRTLSDVLSDSNTSESIDNYQKSLSKIEKALSDVPNLSSSDIFDLMQEFSGFDWASFGITGEKGVGDLRSALNMLATQQKDVVSELTHGSKAIQSMYEEAITASIGVNDLSSVTDASNKKTKLSAEQVDYLTKKYSGLSEYLIKVKNGWYLEAGAIDVVNQAISNLKTDYIAAQTNMSEMMQSESYKRLQALGIELATLTSINSVYTSMGTRAATEENKDLISFANQWFDIKKTIDELYSNISSSVPEIKTGDTSATKEFSQTIDWGTQSLQNLQKTVDDANTKLSNTSGYDAQKQAIEDLITAQEKLRTGYQTNANTSLSEFNSISGIDGYKNKIKSGTTFSKSDFIDEALYNQVKNAQDLWNEYLSSLSKVDQITSDISQNTDKVFELKVDNKFSNLEHDYAMGLKSEKKYYNTRFKYAEKYYKDNEKYQDKWQKEQQTYYQWQKNQEQNKINEKFASLEHDHNMGLVSDKSYYEKRFKYAEKYYKDNKDALDKWRSEQEIYYNWQQEQAENEYKNKKSYIDSKISKRQSLISLRESQGKTATKADYDYLISLQKDLAAVNEAERKAYETTFNQKVKEGLIKKGSTEYYEGLSYLNDLTIAAREAQSTINELTDEQYELKFVGFDAKMSDSNKIIDEINKTTGMLDDNSIEQISLFQTGYSQASDNVKNLNAEIAKLNKQYAKGSVSEKVYKERLAELETQLGTNVDAMYNYQQSIISAMKARYDKELDLQKDALDEELKNIEKLRKAKIEALNDELDKYKEIIDARKKAFRDEQKTDDYNDEVAKYNKDISKLESRIELLKRAELSGDTSARSERIQTEEELVKLQDELKKKQKDREIDLTEDALDSEYDKYKKLKDQQIKDTETFYDNEVTKAQAAYDFKEQQLKQLYENEKQLIIEAANLTQEKFGEAFSAINSTLSQYGISASSGLSDAMSTSKTTTTKTANQSSIAKVLGNSSENNKYKDTSSLSELNQYIAKKGYATLSQANMVKLAKVLGLNDINSTSLVGTDVVGKANKRRILEELKKSGFKTGGIAVDNNLIKQAGENRLAFVRNGEGFVKPEHVDKIKDMLSSLDPIRNIVKDTSALYKDFSAISRNNNPSVIINLPASSTIDNSAIDNYRKFIPEITKEVTKTIMNGSSKR